ncbi:MAG: helix-turn-helix domain-containing protein, partial [Fibrobacteres bacterium]|nr:helix-turn-helix domain-containing protein [Fibrobacterota bacterium]
SLSFIEPTPFAIITKNTVRLSVSDTDSLVKSVQYFIRYKPSIDSFKQSTFGTSFRPIGTSAIPPFDIISDLSLIPDQDERTISFHAICLDENGRAVDSSNDRQFIVLDRKQSLKNSRCISKYRKKFSKWEEIDSVLFFNGENRIVFRTVWNDSFLLLNIDIEDKTIVAEYTERGYLHANLDPVTNTIDSGYVSIPENDEVEIFFDIANEHVMRRNMNQSHMLIGAKGAWFGRRYDRAKGLSEMWGKSAVITVSNDSNGYNIIAQIPWSELRMNPESGKVIGFDIYNKDFSRPGSPSTGISWAGNEWTNYNNPSEWGDLILYRDKKSTQKPIFILTAIIASILVFIIIRARKKTEPPENQKQGKAEKLADKIDELISTNFSDPDFNAQKAADLVGLNAKYVGAAYKSVRSRTFSQQLTQFRIDRAVEFLKTGTFSITDVAFKVGYSSSSHFAKVFKDITQKSPTDFRKT